MKSDMKKYLAVIVLYSLFIVTLSLDSLYSLGITPFRCLFKTLTGYPCPFCGGIRALVSVVTLHPMAAFQWNPLAAFLVIIVLFSLPAAILFLLFPNGLRRFHNRKGHSSRLDEITAPPLSEKNPAAKKLRTAFIKKSLIAGICILVAINWLWLIFWSPHTY